MTSLLFLLLGLPLVAEAGLPASTAVPGGELFAGIAYAEPPVGKLRWQRAVPDSSLRQRAAPVACPQRLGDGTPGPLPAQDEDCLYLNLWRPKAAKRRPVVVFIHGGSAVAGSGLKEFYSGLPFVKRGYLFISFNYRLGILGFHDPALPNPGGMPLGLHDQAAALSWVVKNVESFGGDPGNITVMGHSVGALAAFLLGEKGLAPPQVSKFLVLSAGAPGCFRVQWPGGEKEFAAAKEKPWPELVAMEHAGVQFVPACDGAPAVSWAGKAVAISSVAGEDKSGQVNFVCAARQMAERIRAGKGRVFSFRLLPDNEEHGSELISLFTGKGRGIALFEAAQRRFASAAAPKTGTILVSDGKTGYEDSAQTSARCARPTIRMAVSVDDLPVHVASAESPLKIAEMLLATLKAHSIPGVVGFVNGLRAEQDPATKPVLSLWRHNGFLLGNHTFSHLDLDQVSAEEFIRDVEKNEAILKEFAGGSGYHFFRYPFLHEGGATEKGEAVRNFLAKNGYRPAPASVDYKDYLFQPPLERCLATKDAKGLEALRALHLDSAKKALDASMAIGARQAPRILLVHLSLAQARWFGDVAKSFERAGVRWIPLEEALKEAAAHPLPPPPPVNQELSRRLSEICKAP